MRSSVSGQVHGGLFHKMLRSYRNIGLALGLGLLAVSSPAFSANAAVASDSASGPENTRQKAKEATKTNDSPKGRTVAVVPPGKPKATEQPKKSEYKLPALDNSIWTNWIQAISALIVMVMTGFLAYLGHRQTKTLEDNARDTTDAVTIARATADATTQNSRNTSRLAVAAQNSAEAAERGIRVSREIGKDQSRAYVHIERAELSWGGRNGEAPSVHIVAHNAGQTPAKWFSINTTHFLTKTKKQGDVDEGLDFNTIDFGNKKTWIWPALGGNASFKFKPSKVNYGTKLKEAFGSKDSIINIAGTITYVTIYDEVFVTEFWFMSYPPYKWDYKGNPNAPEGASTFGTGTEIPTEMLRANTQLRTYEKVE
jgi:hypothetical protein